MTAGELGEDALIQRLIKGLDGDASLLVGPGDDCAVTDSLGGDLYQLHKVDSVIAGVHFLPDEQGGRVGWKAVARVLSDFAAMGGYGRYLLVALSCQNETSLVWLEDVYRGINKCARLFNVAVVGGETSSTDGPVTLSLSGVGEVKKSCIKTRSGAKKGDVLLVTGRLGGSINGKHLDFLPRCDEGVWLGEQECVSAMMDVSDGIGKDLQRFGKLSEVGFQLNVETLPLNKGCDVQQGLYDGEDYELLFTVRPSEVESLVRRFSNEFPELLLSNIGKCVDCSQGDQFDGGWMHFANR